MKNAASKTAKRASATVALAATLLATTGCGYIYTQPTTLIYDASDGVSFTMWPKGQRVAVRNIMVISEGKGQPGRVLGTVYNLGETDQTVNFKAGDQNFSIKVPAGKHIKLEDNANQVIMNTVSQQPGELIESVATIGQTEEAFNLPVLDGSLEEYAPYLPNAASSSSASESAAADFEAEENTTADQSMAPATSPASTATPSASSTN